MSSKALPNFPFLLEAFFTKRLMQQRQVSGHTISSYRDTFRMFLEFSRKRLKKAPSGLRFEEIDAPLIAAFLQDLEKTCGVSARTRNLRLGSSVVFPLRCFRTSGSRESDTASFGHSW